MSDYTDNHALRQYEIGDVAEDMERVERHLPIVDDAAELSAYTPHETATFRDPDTGAIYDADGGGWSPARRELDTLVADTLDITDSVGVTEDLSVGGSLDVAGVATIGDDLNLDGVVNGAANITYDTTWANLFIDDANAFRVRTSTSAGTGDTILHVGHADNSNHRGMGLYHGDFEVTDGDIDVSGGIDVGGPLDVTGHASLDGGASINDDTVVTDSTFTDETDDLWAEIDSVESSLSSDLDTHETSTGGVHGVESSDYVASGSDLDDLQSTVDTDLDSHETSTGDVHGIESGDYVASGSDLDDLQSTVDTDMLLADGNETITGNWLFDDGFDFDGPGRIISGAGDSFLQYTNSDGDPRWDLTYSDGSIDNDFHDGEWGFRIEYSEENESALFISRSSTFVDLDYDLREYGNRVATRSWTDGEYTTQTTFSDHESNDSAHHSRYSDSEAVDAIEDYEFTIDAEVLNAVVSEHVETNDGDVEIQIDGSDGQGIINFKTQ